MKRIKSIIESLLFVARKPLSIEEIEKAVSDAEKNEEIIFSRETLSAALEELAAVYQGRGVQIVKVAGGYLMGTVPENANYVYSVLHEKVKSTLSAQSLVTLAIIAYKQPITKAEIERIRGVNSDGPIETLLAKKFIRETGRSDSVGCPYLYGTTEHFLRQFGIHSLDELPPLPGSEEEQEALFETALHEPD